MRSFSEYVDSKQYEAVAICLIENGLDVYDFCEAVLTMAEEDRLDEVGLRNMLGGLSNLAANVAGLGGIGRMAGQAAHGAAQNAAQAVGNQASAAKQAIGNKVNAARQAVGNQFNAAKQSVTNAAQAVGNKASAFGQKVGQNFAQSKNAEQLKQAGNAILALQKQLTSIGYPPNFLQSTLAPLQAQLQKDIAANSQLGHKIGSGMNTPAAAPAAAAQPAAGRAPTPAQAPMAGAQRNFGNLPMARRIG